MKFGILLASGHGISGIIPDMYVHYIVVMDDTLAGLVLLNPAVYKSIQGKKTKKYFTH